MASRPVGVATAPRTLAHNDAAESSETELSGKSKAREAGHSIAIAADGKPYSWCHSRKTCDNELGELGRRGDPVTPLPIELCDVAAVRVYAGGAPDSGHSALLDTRGNLWLCGCDRWQQLGLGSSTGGSSGYTWSRLWQEQFQKNEHVVDLLRSLDPQSGIRDVSLGGDHTVVLSSNKKDVIVFGKGGEKQLGLSSTPWLSSPVKSKVLSSPAGDISAVCAFRHCSMTLNALGEVKSSAGKCPMQSKEMARALEACRKRARQHGLTSRKELIH